MTEELADSLLTILAETDGVREGRVSTTSWGRPALGFARWVEGHRHAVG